MEIDYNNFLGGAFGIALYLLYACPANAPAYWLPVVSIT